MIILMKNGTLITIFLYWLLLFTSQKAAGNEQYTYQQISIQQGLSSSVHCLVVSQAKGYVWIGTRSGVARFDGYELRRYLSRDVLHILEDKENTVWTITTQGVFRYNYKKDEFERVYENNGKPVVATSICLCPTGILFGGGGKLYKYEYVSRRITHFQTLKPNNEYSITSLQFWDEKTLLTTNRWEDTFLIDIQTGQIRSVPFDSKDLMKCFIDRKGNIWVAPYHQGVKCYDRNGNLLHSYNISNSVLRTNVVLSIAEHNGQIWFGTDGGGIYLLNPEDGTMSVLNHIPGNPLSLPGSSIFCLYSDGGIMWAGSTHNGLIAIKEVAMRTYTDALPGVEYGLSAKAVLSLYQDESENIWVGVDGGGINCFNPTTRKFRHIPSTWGDKIAHITGVDSRHLLISKYNKGLFFFDKVTGECRPLTIVNDSINATLCQRGKAVNLLQNTPETVLLLSESPYNYHLIRKTFTPITLDSHTRIVGILLPISNDNTNSFLYDYKHIFRLDDKNHLKTIYSCGRDTVFHSVSLDENGNFWIGSNYGLSYYSPQMEEHVFLSNNLIQEVYSIICDKRGKVWIGTEGKLFAYIIGKKDFILYGESDGAALNEYREKPRLLSSQGDIYMGGVNGLLYISKELSNAAEVLSVLKLAEVWVGGELMNSDVTSELHLEVREQSKPISIKIAVANKDIFQKPMFRFTLQNMDGQIFYSYLPELQLNGLPIGTYQVLASCSTRTGSWTKDYKILALTILPPWYKSGWFIAGYCILILILFIGGVLSILHRKENKLKWAMKEHEQKVYEEKVRFLININHELRTPLTLIHAPLKQLLESLTPKDGNYNMIQNVFKQSGRMKNLLNMVLDVRKMEVGQSTLRIEVVALNLWIEQLIADFKPEAETRGITLYYQSDAEVTNLCFDKEKCTTILTNLLINALKYSPDNTQITITTGLVGKERNCVRISVSDQGTGLKDVDINRLFTRFYQGNNSYVGTGIGLSYSKILAEQHGGSVGAYDHGNTPGATFWFELPCDIQLGKITLQPQSYLNELLAPIQEIESIPKETSTQANTKECNLLIVDDNTDLTDYLHDTLKNRFKEIWIASDGKEALYICQKSRPDIVVSDIQMPCMNGYELCKLIKENLEISHIPVILLTARNDDESQLFGYKNGADVYLTKPFEVDILYTIICNQLKSRYRTRIRYAEFGLLPQPEESTFSSADENFLNQLNQLITENLDNSQMGVPFLCTGLAVSRASLYNKMKALTGMGANDYITKLRIERAIWLLVHCKLNINEIADKTGFSTSRYFSKVFKHYTGCSPTQYKEEHPDSINQVMIN